MINNCLTDELDGISVEPTRTRIWDSILSHFLSLVDTADSSKNFVLLYLHNRRYISKQLQAIFSKLTLSAPAVYSRTCIGFAPDIWQLMTESDSASSG